MMLTNLIYLSNVESVDQSRVCNGIRRPCCFVEAVSKVETQAKRDFIHPQAIAKVVTWICCILNERLHKNIQYCPVARAASNIILACGTANYYRCLAQWSNTDTTLVRVTTYCYIVTLHYNHMHCTGWLMCLLWNRVHWHSRYRRFLVDMLSVRWWRLLSLLNFV